VDPAAGHFCVLECGHTLWGWSSADAAKSAATAAREREAATLDDVRRPFVIALLCLASCSPFGGTTPPEGDAGPGDGSTVTPTGDAATRCQDISGTWNIAENCNGLVTGGTLKVTQTGCSLTVDAPLDTLTGTIIGDTVSLSSAVESCTGTASATPTVTMTCNPGACALTLTR
jgi:hypothetical protein